MVKITLAAQFILASCLVFSGIYPQTLCKTKWAISYSSSYREICMVKKMHQKNSEEIRQVKHIPFYDQGIAGIRQRCKETNPYF